MSVTAATWRAQQAGPRALGHLHQAGLGPWELQPQREGFGSRGAPRHHAQTNRSGFCTILTRELPMPDCGPKWELGARGVMGREVSGCSTGMGGTEQTK